MTDLFSVPKDPSAGGDTPKDPSSDDAIAIPVPKIQRRYPKIYPVPKRPISVGLNGYGVIGRMLVHPIDSRNGFCLKAINDPWETTETMRDTHLDLNGSVVCCCHSKLEDIPWGRYGVECVIDSTGLTKDQAAAHLKGGAKRVVVTSEGDNNSDDNIFFFPLDEWHKLTDYGSLLLDLLIDLCDDSVKSGEVIGFFG